MNDPHVQEVLEQVPEACRDRFLEIVERVDAFADTYLDEEWKRLFVRLAAAVCQKGSPALKGQARSWAAAIIYTVGRVNFLDDPSFEPHMTSDQVAEGAGVSKSNMQTKSGTIRRALGLLPMDPRYTLPDLLASNPLAWLIKVDGYLMDARTAPREVQEAAAAEGVIPFVPGRSERAAPEENAPPQEEPTILRPDFGAARDRDEQADAGRSGAEGPHAHALDSLPESAPLQGTWPPGRAAGETPDYARMVRRYKRLRKVGRRLNNSLVETLSREAIDWTARRLGLWQNGTLVLETRDETHVLMDHAIHACFEDSRNAVDRYIEAHPPEPGSDEAAVLEAARRAFFAILEVEEVMPGVGVWVHDLLRAVRFLLIDLGFSQTAAEGDVLATRLLAFEDFAMTSGAALPASAGCIENVLEYLESSDMEGTLDIERDADGCLRPTRQQEAEAGLEITRLFLEEHASSHIGYQDIDEAVSPASGAREVSAPRPPRPEPLVGGREKVGRNDPCPCGSGRKYKKCCMRKG